MEKDANDELFRCRTDAMEQFEPQVFLITFIYKKAHKMKAIIFPVSPSHIPPGFLEYRQI